MLLCLALATGYNIAVIDIENQLAFRSRFCFRDRLECEETVRGLEAMPDSIERIKWTCIEWKRSVG